MKVLVTGGTGFIGSTLVRHLLSDGHEVRVLVRHKKDSFLLENLNVEIINGDVTSVRAVEKAVRGCDMVFNLASLYAFYPFWKKNPKAIYKINVQGTVNMLNASLKYGVKKFIHTSTIATIGSEPDGKPSDENTRFEDHGASHYARSKYLAEQEVLKFYQQGLPAVILNPAIVIGERDYKPTPSGDVIVKFLNRKYPGYFDTLWSVADADDVARAHIIASERGRIGERYILADNRYYSLRETFQILEKITGISAPRFEIPYWLLLGFTYLEEAFSHFVLRRKPLMPTEGVKFCKMSIPYNNAKSIRELGYRPTPFEETLKKAVLWYRKNGYVEPRGIFRLKAQGSRTVASMMQSLKMDKFTDKFNLGTIGFFGIVKALGLLRKVGIAKKTDGWRKVTRCYLRTEHSKFALAVFGLDFWSDKKENYEKTFVSSKNHCLQRLAMFLKNHSIFYSKLEWNSFSAKTGKKGFFDIVAADFDEDGCLQGLEPFWDSEEDREKFKTIPSDVKELLIKGFIQIYNNTKDLDDKKRPLVLEREWKRWLAEQSSSIPPAWRKQIGNYAKRILSAVFIRFELLSSDSSKGKENRFQAPLFIKCKHPGYGVLNLVCRFTKNLTEADLWFQFSHIPLDGVPAQEILNELKYEWGTQKNMLFPSVSVQPKMVPEICSSADDNEGVFHACQFLDFQPFLEVRKQLNKRFSGRARQVVSSAALLIWKLAQYKEFEDVKFSVPVDLRRTAKRERTLGFIFIRPNTYFNRHKPDRGFFAFQQEFNRQLFATRKRHSESYKILESYAVAPPLLFAMTSKFLADPLKDFVGTLGVTIIKKADFFIAPASDVHTDGFIAFSNFELPSEDGKKVCAVSIKGSKKRVQKYINILHDIMHKAIQYDEFYF